MHISSGPSDEGLRGAPLGGEPPRTDSWALGDHHPTISVVCYFLFAFCRFFSCWHFHVWRDIQVYGIVWFLFETRLCYLLCAILYLRTVESIAKIIPLDLGLGRLLVFKP